MSRKKYNNRAVNMDNRAINTDNRAEVNPAPTNNAKMIREGFKALHEKGQAISQREPIVMGSGVKNDRAIRELPLRENNTKEFSESQKEMKIAMHFDPISKLREAAQEKQAALKKISEAEASLKRAEADISTILVRQSKGFESEILALVSNADDSDGRIIRSVATVSQIQALQYKAGFGELFYHE